MESDLAINEDTPIYKISFEFTILRIIKILSNKMGILTF